MARYLPIAEPAQRRHRSLARFGPAGTAAVEAANIRIGIDRAHRLAGQPQPLRAVCVEPRDGRHQCLGVRVERMLEYLGGRPGFDDFAEIHHQHAIANQPHHGKVVGNEQIAHAEFLLQPLQELKNDHLNRNVERRRRLIEHQQIRLDGDSAGDADAGALAAR